MFEDVGVAEVEGIAECDRLIRVAQARQAELISSLYDKRLESGRTRPAFRIEAGKVAQSVIGEVAMARQISASAAANQFGFALGLRAMTATSRLFADGRISERVAKAVVDEVGGLSPDDADSVDLDLAPNLPTMSAKRAGAAARQLVLDIDPHASRHAANTARRDRHISIHVLPHSMASISMRIPATQAVAVYKTLDSIAQGLKYEGDPRTASQIMCDTAVERITGQERADDIAVEIGILMTSESLLAGEDVPAMLSGYGPVPAAIARQLATGSKSWLRRLFTDPMTGNLVDRDKTRRRFDPSTGSGQAAWRGLSATATNNAPAPTATAGSATSTTNRPSTAPIRPPTMPKGCASAPTPRNTCPVGESTTHQRAPSGPPRPATPTRPGAPTSTVTAPNAMCPTSSMTNPPSNTASAHSSTDLASPNPASTAANKIAGLAFSTTLSPQRRRGPFARSVP